MASRVPPAQRRLVVLSVIALVLAIGLVVAALLFATTRERERGEYEPFRVGAAARLGEHIATERPIFIADPTGGDRGFVLTLVDDDFAALHVVPPGGSRDCPVAWEPEREALADCRDREWEPTELRRFPTRVDDEGLVVVDLRRTIAPEAPLRDRSAG